MHTNNAMLRQFSWATNSLFPEDLAKNNIPSTIILTEKDEIVPTLAVEELFREYNGKNRMTEQSTNMKFFEGASHGEMFFDESLRNDTASVILNLMKKNRKNSIVADPISMIKKEYKELNDSVGEFWDQISYILPRAARATVSSVGTMKKS